MREITDPHTDALGRRYRALVEINPNAEAVPFAVYAGMDADCRLSFEADALGAPVVELPRECLKARPPAARPAAPASVGPPAEPSSDAALWLMALAIALCAVAVIAYTLAEAGVAP